METLCKHTSECMKSSEWIVVKLACKWHGQVDGYESRNVRAAISSILMFVWDALATISSLVNTGPTATAAA